MTEGITLITPTGSRPESLERSWKYVSRFKVDVPVQCIVVDDTYEGTSMKSRIRINEIQCDLLFPSHKWKPGMNTLALNLLAAIPLVEHNCVLFIEDDDWYSPDYVIVMYEALQSGEIVGEIPSRYYHIPSRRYRSMENKFHASLCQTGIRSTILPQLKTICEASAKFIDVRLWHVLTTNNYFKHLLKTQNCVGMKGLPGRPGIGIGHSPDKDWQSDPDVTVLKSWIGEDIELYAANLAASGRYSQLLVAR